ncbi:MAG: hypothetical protein ACRES4_06365 [Nevskiales bacterium]
MQTQPTRDSADRPFDLTRRSFLKLGVAGSVALGTTSLVANLAGCGKREQAIAQGFAFLRDADVTLFRALTPVVLGAALPADAASRESLTTETLKRIDGACFMLEPNAQGEVLKLFDLLHMRVTRWLTTGVSAPWPEAEAADIERFLERWRGSSVGIFNAGYRLLTKLVAASYYAIPATWPLSGYPGPLAAVYQLVNA